MEFVGANSFARNCLNVRMNSHPHLLLFLGSGLGYYKWMADNRPEWSLNPFSFRAGVLLTFDTLPTAEDIVSIPFHSGLGYYHQSSSSPGIWFGLNPFSFRAGVLPKKYTRINRISVVSIPFHSGLGYYNGKPKI